MLQQCSTTSVIHQSNCKQWRYAATMLNICHLSEKLLTSSILHLVKFWSEESYFEYERQPLPWILYRLYWSEQMTNMCIWNIRTIVINLKFLLFMDCRKYLWNKTYVMLLWYPIYLRSPLMTSPSASTKVFPCSLVIFFAISV